MNIRASMLPGHSDCQRRSVAKQFKRKFQKLGYEFRELDPSIGSSVGTAVHASTAILDIALWNGTIPNVDQAVEAAMAGFMEEVSTGCILDATTPSVNAAQQQIRIMTASYIPRMPMTINGEPAVELGGEQGLSADCGDGWILTGHPDLIDERGFLLDKKTGVKQRPYQEQFGGYSLLVRSNALAELTGVGMLYIPRLAKGKFQPPPVMQEYGIAICERNAMGVIHQIKASMTVFDATEDLARSFACNQSSMMCSDKYCMARHTDFCEMTKGVL